MSEGSSGARVVSTERFEALRREYRLRSETNRARRASNVRESADVTGAARTESGSGPR